MLLSTVLAGALLATPALAKKPKAITRIPAEQVAVVVQSHGFGVEQGTDSVGDPFLGVTGKTFNHVVAFYNCTEEGCAGVQFRIWWTADRPVDMGLVNAYNATNRQGRAYLDRDGDPTYELLVELEGGVMLQHVADRYQTFLEGVELFRSQVIEAS